jgi:uncharacterized protein (TIGR00255 family)
MLRSMTGFGNAHGRVEGVEYDVEARSVNHRFFKADLNLPECWSSAEADVERILRAKIARGSVVLTVRMKVPDEQAAYRVNVAALQSYLEQLRPLEVEGNPMMRVELGQLMQLPGVCESPRINELLERSREGLMALVEQAADRLVEMRRHEGQVLKADLLAQCEAISKGLVEVAALAPQVVRDYQQRLADRVAELTGSGRIAVDPDVVAREVAIFAERCDVAEELSRLSGHVKHFRQGLTSGEPSGRRMDFLAQEMLREANTIASKANNGEIARVAVDIKTAIDRIKEQVQNVE